VVKDETGTVVSITAFATTVPVRSVVVKRKPSPVVPSVTVAVWASLTQYSAR
jgi:hypothetical protein